VSSAEGNLLRLIPTILVKLNCHAFAYKHTEEKDGKLVLKGDPSASEERLRKDRIWSWKANDHIKLRKKKKGEDGGTNVYLGRTNGVVRNLIENYSDILPEVLDLCFHGTSNTKDLIDIKLYHRAKGVIPEEGDPRPKGYIKETPQATACMFKDGFFIDPAISVGSSTIDKDGKLFFEC
jgi:hypothetical protein